MKSQVTSQETLITGAFDFIRLADATTPVLTTQENGKTASLPQRDF